MAAAGVRRNDERDRAVCVHVIRAVLGVVLGHEDCRLAPELALCERLDDATEGQVVVGDLGGRRRFAGAGAEGVVVRQADDLQPGHIALALEPL